MQVDQEKKEIKFILEGLAWTQSLFFGKANLFSNPQIYRQAIELGSRTGQHGIQDTFTPQVKKGSTQTNQVYKNQKYIFQRPVKSGLFFTLEYVV